MNSKNKSTANKNRNPNRRHAAVRCARAAFAAVLFCAVIASACSSHREESSAETQDTSAAAKETKEESYFLSIDVSIEGWDADTSSPVIVHVVGKEQGADYYHAYDANADHPLPLPGQSRPSPPATAWMPPPAFPAFSTSSTRRM